MVPKIVYVGYMDCFHLVEKYLQIVDIFSTTFPLVPWTKTIKYAMLQSYVLYYVIQVVGFSAAVRNSDVKQEEGDVFQPMVAFQCYKGLPAMHLNPDKEWAPDQTTSCLRHPDAVTNYCRQVSTVKVDTALKTETTQMI